MSCKRFLVEYHRLLLNNLKRKKICSIVVKPPSSPCHQETVEILELLLFAPFQKENLKLFRRQWSMVLEKIIEESLSLSLSISKSASDVSHTLRFWRAYESKCIGLWNRNYFRKNFRKTGLILLIEIQIESPLKFPCAGSPFCSVCFCFA